MYNPRCLATPTLSPFPRYPMLSTWPCHRLKISQGPMLSEKGMSWLCERRHLYRLQQSIYPEKGYHPRNGMSTLPEWYRLCRGCRAGDPPVHELTLFIARTFIISHMQIKGIIISIVNGFVFFIVRNESQIFTVIFTYPVWIFPDPVLFADK